MRNRKLAEYTDYYMHKLAQGLCTFVVVMLANLSCETYSSLQKLLSDLASMNIVKVLSNVFTDPSST